MVLPAPHFFCNIYVFYRSVFSSALLYQAETLEISEVKGKNTLVVRGEIRHTHYASTHKGVEMHAEVGGDAHTERQDTRGDGGEMLRGGSYMRSMSM